MRSLAVEFVRVLSSRLLPTLRTTVPARQSVFVFDNIHPEGILAHEWLAGAQLGGGETSIHFARFIAMNTFPFHKFILSKDRKSISSLNIFVNQLLLAVEDGSDVIPDIGFVGFPYDVFEFIFQIRLDLCYSGYKIDEMFERKQFSLQDALDIFFSIHRYSMGFELVDRELLSSKESFLISKSVVFNNASTIDDFIETWKSKEERVFLLSSLDRRGEFISYDNSIFQSKEQAMERRKISFGGLL
jgi:hypothetical protein